MEAYKENIKAKLIFCWKTEQRDRLHLGWKLRKQMRASELRREVRNDTCLGTGAELPALSMAHLRLLL